MRDKVVTILREFTVRPLAFSAAIMMTMGTIPAFGEDIAVDVFAATASEGTQYVAPQRSAIKKDFAFPVDGTVRIVLFRPEVRVTEQSAAGMEQPKADWTETARLELTTALQRAQLQRSNEMRMMPELTGVDEKLMADYRRLFKVVADAAIRYRLFSSQPLPTKTDGFEWTLGPGISSLGTVGAGDYGLFLYTNDSYESPSRKNAALIARLMGQNSEYEESNVRIGYAGLVDLKTGNLIWLNVDVRGSGDVRTADGADARIAELLKGFPARTRVKPERKRP
jgi:hypothetical protein